ncbi:MAG: glycosyltransferase family 2 protein [Rhizobiales bacterium]|nr:glycosyltransferase family 2 protein [Hyphomicrobiales bacterium]
MGAVEDGISYLTAQSGASLMALFWFTILFEIPRYTLSFLAAAIAAARTGRAPSADPSDHRISVIVAGHNERDAIERCVMSLREQSVVPDEIIVVSDGSGDGMAGRLGELRDRGLITQALATDLRAGKAAATNLGLRWATGDIILNVDCDCSYDRHAIKRIIAPFADSEVGAVSGNILVRNPQASLVATFQAIEYLISISLGKQASAFKDQVVCVSGAFGAFRRTALDSVNGLDVGGGEDLDVTIRMRCAGWRMGFAADAICYTDVPDTMRSFLSQRYRWEGDALRLRYRKHLALMNPLSHRFQLSELMHEIDFIVFHVIGSIMLPFYVAWLFLSYGMLAPLILLAAQAGLVLLDLVAFILSALVTPKFRSLPLLPYVIGFGTFNGIIMRHIRLAAYMREWLFNASARDNYVPEKVRLVRRW